MAEQSPGLQNMRQSEGEPEAVDVSGAGNTESQTPRRYRLRWWSKATPGVSGGNRWFTNTYRDRSKFVQRIEQLARLHIDLEIMEDNLCTQCKHPEADHGPESGRWTDGSTIPGRLCYYMENQGYSQDLCPCSGFNLDPETEGLTHFETVLRKAGVK